MLQREKQLILNVKHFNEMEARKAAERLKGEDDYVKEIVDDTVKVPFRKHLERTYTQTGVS